MNTERAIVISRHIDDAVISIGDTLRKFDNALVLNIFNQSRETITGVNPKRVDAIRRAEDTVITNNYGYDFAYANLPDTSLRGVEWDDFAAPVNYDLLEQARYWIKTQLESQKGDFGLFIPASYGLHPDHYLTTLTFSEGELSYLLDWVPFEIYCEQPYFLVDNGKRHDHQGTNYLKNEGKLIVNTFDVVYKREMLRVYESQLSEQRIQLLAGKNRAEFVWRAKKDFFTKSKER